MAITVAGSGAACLFNSGSFIFAKASDNKLWVAWPSVYGTDSLWMPLFGPISDVIGAVSSGPFMFCFFQAPDNSLGCSYYNNTSVQWQTVALGKPTAAVAISAPVGALVVNNFVYVFVIGTDGNLWCDWWTGFTWEWVNLGSPPDGKVASKIGIAVPGQTGLNGNPYINIFVLGTDHAPWACTWTGAQWVWQTINGATDASQTPVGVASAQGSMFVFTLRSGQLWCGAFQNFTRNPDGSVANTATWSWSSVGTPPGVGIAGALGCYSLVQQLPPIMVPVMPAPQPRAYVYGTDGRLWGAESNGAKWSWVNRAHPHFSTVAGPVGLAASATVVGATSQTQSALDALTMVGGAAQIGVGAATENPGTAITGVLNLAKGTAAMAGESDGTVINVAQIFLRGADGHLWQYYIDNNDFHWTDMGTVDWT